MIPNWPEKLPCPLADSYSYAPKVNAKRTQMESGTARHRRLSRKIPHTVSVKWLIPKADIADFRYFAFDIVNVVGFFTTPLRFDEQIKQMRARFINPTEPFTVTNVQNFFFEVVAQLEVLEMDIISADTYLSRNADYLGFATDGLHTYIHNTLPVST